MRIVCALLDRKPRRRKCRRAGESPATASGATKMITPYVNKPTRSLEQAQADLQEQFDRLPLTDPRRPELARMIRQLDDESIAREGL